jgi:hypothetical protein
MTNANAGLSREELLHEWFHNTLVDRAAKYGGSFIYVSEDRSEVLAFNETENTLWLERFDLEAMSSALAKGEAETANLEDFVLESRLVVEIKLEDGMKIEL